MIAPDEFLKVDEDLRWLVTAIILHCLRMSVKFPECSLPR